MPAGLPARWSVPGSDVHRIRCTLVRLLHCQLCKSIGCKLSHGMQCALCTVVFMCHRIAQIKDSSSVLLGQCCQAGQRSGSSRYSSCWAFCHPPCHAPQRVQQQHSCTRHPAGTVPTVRIRARLWLIKTIDWQASLGPAVGRAMHPRGGNAEALQALLPVRAHVSVQSSVFLFASILSAPA